MSSDPSSVSPGTAPWNGPSVGPPADAPDADLVQRTRQEIGQLVSQIAQLSQSDISLAEFYDGFLGRVVTAMAAVAGAVWTVAEDGRLHLAYQINLPGTGLTDDPQRQTRHGLLLRRTARSEQAVLMPPHAGAPEDEEAGNPTDFLLVVQPLHDGQRLCGLVEVFQRSGAGPTTQRGYQRFLAQVCEYAGDYLKSHRLRQYRDRQALWEQLERFLATVHRDLDVQRTAYAIANEGRRLIGCDRLSVAIARGGRMRVEAVSGASALDGRSTTVAALGRLATKAARTGQAIWYLGRSESLPPQIEEALHEYVDAAHSKLLAVLPLAPPSETPPDSDRRGPSPRETIGALVVENLQSSAAGESLRRRAELVAEHGATALGNALAHEGLFLMPLWRALGKATWLVKARTLPKTLAFVLLLLATAAALVFTPARFELEGRGTLQPRVTRDIFAQTGGVVAEVPVVQNQLVDEGQVLARLTNTDLDVAVADLIGRQTAAREQILSVSRALLGEAALSADRQDELAGRLDQLKQTEASLEKQLALYRRKQEQLVVRSPIRGQVVSWQVRDRLIHRPVERGDVLLTVADPEGPWHLELLMPESRMGHVMGAFQQAQSAGRPLKATFLLATHPGQRFTGEVAEIHAAADLRGEEGNTVLVRVAIDKEQLPDLRRGAAVTAKIDCGYRPLGYVWFHDLLAFVQRKVLFWF